MFNLWESTLVTVVILPCAAAFLMLASPVVINPKIDTAEAEPSLGPIVDPSVSSGILELLYKMPLLPGLELNARLE